MKFGAAFGLLGIVGGLTQILLAKDLAAGSKGAAGLVGSAVILSRCWPFYERQFELIDFSAYSEDEILAWLASRRYGVTQSTRGLRIHIGSPPLHTLAGLLFLAVVAANWAGIVLGCVDNFNTYGWNIKQYVAMGLFAIFGFLFALMIYPWWWFLGGETIEFDQSTLRYKPGFQKLRRYQLGQISDVSFNAYRIYVTGYRIHFKIPPTDIRSGIGRHLADKEAPAVIRLIQLYQSKQ
ncbi:MAG: hypothetical protein ABIR70_12865 [Bryobacteraceae bacterium]